ncbi:MAG TPA: septal ring lytic transglycosylase RlpA family protein [Aestuariivirgaceae bacterium]|nr:septal ring lytic transglycosylase RlpA family protein [Aestuariivirgaceae bacterium]
MWSARLATFIAGLLLMAVPAVAVKFEDHGGLTIPRHMPPNALKFSHASTGIPGARVIPAAMTFSDRPSLNHHRTAAPAHRPMRFADRPGFNLRQIAVAPITRTSMRFEERPGLNLRPVAARLVEPLRFTDYCAGTANCGPFDVALHRALQLPEQDAARIAIRLDSVIARGRLTSALPLDAAGPVVAATETCRTFLLSKLDYFACLRLPSGTLKKEIGSPMFKRAGLIPRGGGRYQLGTPYRIGGHLFRPRKVPDYDEIGIASWYGHRFHRRMTANGEWFDMEYFTAAHPTMPLPSYARVVNLENGKEMVVRVNDRGPFVGSRLIDLSKKTAEMLQFRVQGIAKVRVQYIGPAPLDDNGQHLAAVNFELRRGTPLAEIITLASGLRQQHAMAESARANASLPAQAF